jgi:hypothetical protein
MGTAHDGLRKFTITSRSKYGENKNAYFIFNNVFPKNRAVNEKM